MTFDPQRRIAMAAPKTVLGHNLPAGTALTIVDEPKARGEIDQALANRLFEGGLAKYQDEMHATPVETPEQERNRLAAEALREAGPDVKPDELTATDDLRVWQEDDDATGRKKGQKVTNDDLRAIADREGVTVESDDNKPDLIRKIMEVRAQRSVQNTTNAGSDNGGGADEPEGSGATGREGSEGADSGATGGE